MDDLTLYQMHYGVKTGYFLPKGHRLLYHWIQLLYHKNLKLFSITAYRVKKLSEPTVLYKHKTINLQKQIVAQLAKLHANL